MRDAFAASLCWYGAQGGGLYADDKRLVFRAQKLTLPDDLKKIGISYSEIKEAIRCRSFLFPAVNLQLENGNEYKFIVFGRKRLLKILGDKKVMTSK